MRWVRVCVRACGGYLNSRVATHSSERKLVGATDMVISSSNQTPCSLRPDLPAVHTHCGGLGGATGGGGDDQGHAPKDSAGSRHQSCFGSRESFN